MPLVNFSLTRAHEKVTEKIDKISVFGGLDAVLKDLVKIR